MSKYFDDGGKGRVLTVDMIDSKIIKDEMKQELVEEMKNEKKQVVKFEESLLKPIDA